MTTSGFYTGKGDRGDTGRLLGTDRVAKNSALIETIGTMDEATAAIGMARALSGSASLKEALTTVQRHLYRLMSHLSAVPEAREHYVGLTDLDVTWLQELIASLEAEIPPLTDFVLPGETPASAAAHVARTVVRRAERRLVAVTQEESNIGNANLAYVNRLSSLMFVAALYEDEHSGTQPRLAKAQPSDR